MRTHKYTVTGYRDFQVLLTPANRMKYMKVDLISSYPNLNSATRVSFGTSEFRTLLHILDASSQNFQTSEFRTLLNILDASSQSFETSEFRTLLNILDASSQSFFFMRMHTARTCDIKTKAGEGYNKQHSLRCRSCEHAAPALALPENTISIRENRRGCLV
jgi:hypothetical protein